MATTTKTKSTTDMNNEAVEKVMKAGKDTFESAIKAGADAASKSVEQTAKMTREQFDSAIKGYDEMASTAKANIEALIESGKAVATGLEAVNTEFMDFSKKQFEGSVKASKALAGAKTAQELFDLQSDLTKKTYESFVDRWTKMSELMVKVAQDAAEPVNSRVMEMTQKYAKPMAL
jgi:phasin family protein